MIGTEKPMNHIDWLQRIAADPSLDSLSRWQAGRILRETPPDKRSVAFYCPTKSFRKLFGSIPNLLEDRGIHVIYLYGERHLDDYENHPNAYQIWGRTLAHLGFIDLFIVPTIMDCLPLESRKMLLLHTSFGGVPFSTNATASLEETQDATTPLSDEELVIKYTHMSAFWPLYDYISAATPDICSAYEKNFQSFQTQPVSHPFESEYQMDEMRLHDYQRLKGRLRNKRLANSQCVIPLGYPSLDEGMHRATASTQERDCITYAPTPVIGKEHWEPYTSIRSHGVQIIERLLQQFPDNPVVFKPYTDDDFTAVQPILDAGSRHPNFIHDISGGNYHDLYERTAVLISDFSGAAYTFSLAHSRPTVFFSHNEVGLPESVKQSQFCQFRTKIGTVSTHLQGLLDSVAHALTCPQHYVQKIQSTREQNLFNAGNSAAYFADNIDYILQDRTHPDWKYYGSLHSLNPKRSSQANLIGEHQQWQERVARHHHLGDQSLQQAQIILNKRDAAETLKHLYHGFQNFPDHISIAQILGQLEILLGRHKNALEPSFRALQMNPFDISNHIRIVHIFLKLGMHEDANSQIELVRKLDPNHPDLSSLLNTNPPKSPNSTKSLSPTKPMVGLC